MASPLRTTAATAAMGASSTACLGCLARPSLLAAARSARVPMLPVTILAVQTRGKKMKREHGVVVRLLEDVSHFGRKDTILRVERGRMRNFWYPSRTAEYMTAARFAELGRARADTVAPRDPFFAAHQADAAPEAQAQPSIRLQTVDAERAAALLETLVPPALVFYRKPIAPGTAAIFGSVSADDVATAVREVLRASPEPDAALVRIEPRDVRFVAASDNRQAADSAPDRIKALGRWEVEIAVHGSQQQHGADAARSALAAAAASAIGGGVPFIRKTVVVQAQEG